ncbi:MAG: YdcF family protein [Phycisphaerae bacterium]
MSTPKPTAERSSDDLPAAPRARHPRTRRCLRWIEHLLAAGAALWGLLIVSPIPDWIENAMDCQDPLARADYILCLGGEPARVLEATKLLQEGYAEKLVVSNRGESARQMRDLAVEWGAPPEKVLVEDRSRSTMDHPRAIQRAVGLDPARDVCIIVTSYTHLPRSRACFAKAGYRHLIMRDLRWERAFRRTRRPTWRGRFLRLPKLVYEGAAWCLYWVRDAV